MSQDREMRIQMHVCMHAQLIKIEGEYNNRKIPMILHWPNKQ